MNNIILDQRYADMLSPQLEGYKLKSSTPYRANFRCPVCGDSAKNRFKKRGWILETDDRDGLVYYCHNCNASQPFGAFLEFVNSGLYESYSLERKKDFVETMGRLREISKPKEALPQQTTFVRIDPTELVKISSLKPGHYARDYIIDERKIPSNQHYRIFYVKDFNGWINKSMPNKLPNVVDSRIVLPICNREKKLIGVTARTMKKELKPGELRYINIMFNESQPKTYGLDRVDFDKPYFITEGIFDSFFLPNSIAINGSAINFDILENHKNAIFVLDNQPRDKGVVRSMQKVIQAGMRVVVWPTSPIWKMDINQMVLDGIDYRTIIKNNVYKGAEAVMRLNQWRRINVD